MTKTIGFKIDCEWLCNFVRQRVYWEGLPFTDGIEQLRASFGCSEEIALDILTGRKKVVGINEGYLEDDDRYEDYKAYLKREENKKKKAELEQDIFLHPLTYFDPFGATWSYKEFCNRYVDGGVLINYEVMQDYFMRPPCEAETDPYLLGGMWSIDPSVAEKIIHNSADKEEFYERLYKIVEGWLKDDIPESLKRRMRIRQRAYELYKTKHERREKRMEQILAKGKELAKEEIAKYEEGKRKEARKKAPTYVIDQSTNTYTLYDGSESYYLRNAKFVPCPEGVFNKWGIISPDGDFYACDFAGHKGAAFTIAKQKGMIQVPDAKFFENEEEEYDAYDEEKTYDSAKDLLFDKGYVFVNTAYGYMACKDGPFFSKWGKIEDMPQRLMNACYDWEIWWRSRDE